MAVAPVPDAVFAQLRDLIDKAEIRELTARYNKTFDDCDAEAYADTWTEDGVMVLDGVEDHRGREAFIRDCLNWAGRIVHTTTDPMIVVNGDEATQWCTVISYTRSTDRRDNAFLLTGTYHDTLVRTADGWKFKVRRATTDRNWEAPPPEAGS
ncbi:nuclear transport factor 2 family protein [Amycolatopsis thermophila]|uniref:Ketosteroid isomerase-like protein n=1 Tax=Amycolatopsis thermophila TaxID=206084 RepID=A0ABU0F507_9PSEU|nr:nuclear transport factor 2 family protein [Amycolatopsis thermophila]MDQ0382669.1 ketosteroid isomerase-like protein [Amycolatopsis thermophila]